MSKKTLAKAPYSAFGSLLDYVADSNRVMVDWRENKPFRALLILQGTERGRSAARFVWSDEDGHLFRMFMADMVDLITRGTTYKGTVDAWWIVQKRGQNYGIRLAKPEETAATETSA